MQTSGVTIGMVPNITPLAHTTIQQALEVETVGLFAVAAELSLRALAE